MKTITSHKLNGLNDAIHIAAVDEPGPGGANHDYLLVLDPEPNKTNDQERTQLARVLRINFQNGPIKEGFNGFTNEAILAVLIHRMEGFQSGQFKCRENAIALTHLEEAMMWLQKRTRDRMARGVEGTLAA